MLCFINWYFEHAEKYLDILIEKAKIQLEFLIISLNFLRMWNSHRCLKNLVRISHNLESNLLRFITKKNLMLVFFLIYLFT